MDSWWCSGRTGRNFAAGMTGGIAYVLDQIGDFASVRCNRTEVDLEPVTNANDIEMLHQLDFAARRTDRQPAGEVDS